MPEGDNSDPSEFETIDQIVQRINEEPNIETKPLSSSSKAEPFQHSEEVREEIERTKGYQGPIRSSRPIDGPVIKPRSSNPNPDTTKGP